MLATLLAIHATASAMPPAPGLIERLRSEFRLEALSTLHTNARANGVNAPFDFDAEAMRRDGSDEITYHVVCILVDFADNEANVNIASPEHFEEMLFSEGEYATGSMKDWYLENSYGQVHITGDVAGWYRMEHDYAYYVNGQQGFGQYPRNGQGLARDALRAADGDLDYRNYDNNNNRVAEGVFIVHAGIGAEETGSDSMIWSHAWGVPRDLRLDNTSFASYAMEPENGRVGVFGHELGHSLFGLPDLYDTGYNSAGVGVWSMMSGGSWGGGGLRPVHFDAWCKMKTGMVTPFPIIEDNPDIVMPPVQRDDEVFLLWRREGLANEYFLVENRQRIGFDTSLPEGGLLVWHCDDNAESNANPWWPGQGGEHNIVALEQADGNYNLEHDANGGDGSDPFPGNSWNTEFGDDTSPDSRDYSGRTTNVVISNIEQVEDEQMRLDIYVDNAPQPIEPNLFLLTRVPESHTFPHPDVQADTTDEVTLVRRYLSWIGASPSDEGTELPENLFDYNAVVYIESWRDGEEPAEGLTEDEQYNLTLFLEIGGKLLMIGPDIATNIVEDSLLWPYCHANLYGDGEPRTTGNLRTLTGNPESRIAGQNFVYRQRGITDHYVDVVDPAEGAQALFTDQAQNSRGVMYIGDTGYRLILQPFLFGGMVDWGGSKVDLLRSYLEYFRFVTTEVDTEQSGTIPGNLNLTETYPNPFNGSLNVRWTNAPEGAWINIFDVSGRKIGKMNIAAGSGIQAWQPGALPTGDYWLQPNSPGSNTHRVTFLR